MIKELLTQYSPAMIIICCILILAAVKSVIEYKEWAQKKLDEGYNKRRAEEESRESTIDIIEKQDKQLQTLGDNIEKLSCAVDRLAEKVELLTESDKDDIKAFITREYHYFCEQKKWIDDYSMDCIEKRFEHYQKEGGNSFVETLMEQLRALPRTAPKDE